MTKNKQVVSQFKNWSKNEIFSKTSVPPETPFYLRLDGWRFRVLAEDVGAEKPFDERFAKCLVSSGRAIFERGFSPTLVYVFSDELNILFDGKAPFNGRIEKIDSVIPSLVSTAFSIKLQELFNKKVVAAFDSRVIVCPSDEKILEYLVWRQTNAWRNHNNAYAYWLFRKMGYKPSEIAKKLKGMKTEELHEILFKHGVNLAQTPSWQRRGILIHKKPYQKETKDQSVIRWKITENWDLPLFSSEEGTRLIRQILEWMRQKRRT